jgi:hypothetical protein
MNGKALYDRDIGSLGFTLVLKSFAADISNV